MIHVEAEDFARAHKRLTASVLIYGRDVPTDYDHGGEPESKDCPATVIVERPWHRSSMRTVFSKAVYDTPEGLLAYADEIVHGTTDWRAEALSYTYHDRFGGQLEGLMRELRRNLCTRRAQVITWRPDEDLGSRHPPCLQRAWFRVIEDGLQMHTHWRSRDVWKAWGSNVFGLAHLHKWVADNLGYPPGRYVEMIDSAHVYGRDVERAQTAVLRDVEHWTWDLWEITQRARGA